MMGDSQSKKLVELALGAFDFYVSESGEPFAIAGDSHISRMLRGGTGSLRAAQAIRFHETYGTVPSQQALADSLKVLEGLALRAGVRELHLRIARTPDGFVLDLGRRDEKVVVVTASGWQVQSDSPVFFRRSELTGELPLPIAPGDLELLRTVLNLSETDWPLVRAWLVALFLSIPQPILCFVSEQGRGKTTSAKHIAATVDPSPAQVSSMPRDPDQWAVQANGLRVIAFDNVSHVPQSTQDTLCRLVTGDGWVKRRLYSESDITVLSYRRAIIMTSIDTGALRGDLGDRLLPIESPLIDERSRMYDVDLQATFQRLHPTILGGLLDLAVQVLGELPDVTLDRKPRMADFARVVKATDTICGTNAFDTYRGMRGRIAEDVIEGDRVALALRDFIEEHHSFDGTASELLDRLTRPEPTPKDWPSTPQAMAGALRRIGPALREIGIEVEHQDRRSGDRRGGWIISEKSHPENEPERTSQTSLMSQPAPQTASEGDILPADVTFSTSPDQRMSPRNNGSTSTDDVHDIHDVLEPHLSDWAQAERRSR